MEPLNSPELQQFVKGRDVQRPVAVRIFLATCWYLLHLVISIILFCSHVVQDIMYGLISSGVRRKYQNIRPVNLKHLAIVFDKENVKLTSKIMELLDWLSRTGVHNLILYDTEGILKKSVSVMKREFDSNSITFRDNAVKDLNIITGPEMLSIEVLSYSDNKEAVAKAASYLCTETLNDEKPTVDNRRLPYDEADIGRALNAVGCGGPSPDLLLVFGGARCHFGFPAWRLRYTEIVHIGQLETLNYGAIIKAFYRFSITHQNYGA